MSYAAEVVADASGKFNGNALRFETKGEAEVYVADLARRWILVSDTRVVESEDPVTHRIEDGVIAKVTEQPGEVRACRSCGFQFYLPLDGDPTRRCPECNELVEKTNEREEA